MRRSGVIPGRGVGESGLREDPLSRRADLHSRLCLGIRRKAWLARPGDYAQQGRWASLLVLSQSKTVSRWVASEFYCEATMRKNARSWVCYCLFSASEATKERVDPFSREDST
jgi:hypothetical protein